MARIFGRAGAFAAYRQYVRWRSLITVVYLHGVSPQRNAIDPGLTPDDFRELCRYLKKHFYVTLFRHLGDETRKISGKPKLILSFDDGLKTFMDYALPILVEEDLRANVNVVTKCADSGRPYPWLECIDVFSSMPPVDLPMVLRHMGADDLIGVAGSDSLGPSFTQWFQSRSFAELNLIEERVTALRAAHAPTMTRMMVWDDIREADRLGFEIGSHTVTHASLDCLDAKAMMFELSHSKQEIETVLGHGITVIAFPGGRHNQEVIEASRIAGYSHLLTTGDRLNKAHSSVWSRILVYGDSQDRLRARVTGFESAVRSMLAL